MTARLSALSMSSAKEKFSLHMFPEIHGEHSDCTPADCAALMTLTRSKVNKHEQTRHAGFQTTDSLAEQGTHSIVLTGKIELDERILYMAWDSSNSLLTREYSASTMTELPAASTRRSKCARSRTSVIQSTGQQPCISVCCSDSSACATITLSDKSVKAQRKVQRVHIQAQLRAEPRATYLLLLPSKLKVLPAIDCDMCCHHPVLLLLLSALLEKSSLKPQLPFSNSHSLARGMQLTALTSKVRSHSSSSRTVQAE